MSKPSRKERQQDKKVVSSMQRANIAKAKKTKGENMSDRVSFSLKYGIILLLLIVGLFFLLKMNK